MYVHISLSICIYIYIYTHMIIYIYIEREREIHAVIRVHLWTLSTISNRVWRVGRAQQSVYQCE